MEIQLDTWYPTPGAIPSTGSDTLGVYDAWQLNDEATRTEQIPETYQPNTNLTIELHEASAGTSQKHKWQISVSRNGATAQIFTAEFTSGAVANTISTRTITISTDGQINGVQIQKDDQITIVLKRIAASDTEDPNPIRVYTYILGLQTVATGTAACVGRLGKIIDRVTWNVNETLEATDFFTSAHIVDLCNQCTMWMAANGYRWKTTFDLSLVADQQVYDLESLATKTFAGLQWLQWVDTKQKIRQLATRQELERIVSIYQSGDRPYCFHLDGSEIAFAPIPSVADSGAVRVFHYYIPDDLECLTAFTPEIPEVHDLVYVNYCTAALFRRERAGIQGNVEMANIWDLKTMLAFRRLLAGTTGRLVLRGSR